MDKDLVVFFSQENSGVISVEWTKNLRGLELLLPFVNEASKKIKICHQEGPQLQKSIQRMQFKEVTLFKS